MFNCIVGLVVPDVCKDHYAFIFKVKHLNLNMKAQRSFCARSLLVSVHFLACFQQCFAESWGRYYCRLSPTERFLARYISRRWMMRCFH